MNVIISLASLLAIPETHPWYILLSQSSGAHSTIDSDMSKMDGLGDNAPSDLEEQQRCNEKAENGRGDDDKFVEEAIAKPELMMPWEPLEFMAHSDLTPYYCLACASFASMFTSLTILPFYLHQEPYHLSEAIVGVCYLPVGAAMLLGAVLGGSSSDWSAAAFPRAFAGRLVYPFVMAGLVIPGCIGFGFTLQYGTSLAGPLLTQCVLGFGQAVAMPGMMGFFTEARPLQAASAGSVQMFLSFVAAAIVISFSVPIVDKIGIGYFFVILAGLNTITLLWSFVECRRAIRDSPYRSVRKSQENVAEAANEKSACDPLPPPCQVADPVLLESTYQERDDNIEGSLQVTKAVDEVGIL